MEIFAAENIRHQFDVRGYGLVDISQGYASVRRRGRLRNIFTESPELALFFVDAIVLVGCAGLAAGAANLVAGEPLLRIESVAALLAPIAVLLAALNLSGAYTREGMAQPGRILRRVGFFWALLQISVFATVSRFGPDLLSLDHGLLAFALLAPAALLPQRGVLAVLASGPPLADTRHPKVFLVAESIEAAEAYPLKHGCAVLPSLSITEQEPLQRLLADVLSSGCDEIHILPQSSSSTLGTVLVRTLRLASAPVRLIASADQAELLRFPVSRVGTRFAFDIERPRLRLSDRLLKRAFDVTTAALLCVFFSPLLLLAAAAVRSTSAGPALFRQPRIGRDGHVFLIYKFRTMTVQETGTEVVQARRRDPRVTPIGCVLRASSIDELPQLFNVLLGEMSLVGPRPHAVTHDQDFAGRVEDYRFRQLVKPGLTGLAQVSGARGEISDVSALKRRVALDLQYVEQWSMLLDIQILLRTVAVVFDCRKAY